MKYLYIAFCLLWAANAFGLELKDSVAKTDPTVVEGTFLLVSRLPPPKGNAYPDCYYTAVIDIAHISSGRSIPKKIVLVMPGFFSREY